MKLGIKLGRLRNLTHKPDALADYVFTNPEIIAELEKQDIHVATRNRFRRTASE
jgi:hypothetical protein